MMFSIYYINYARNDALTTKQFRNTRRIFSTIIEASNVYLCINKP